MRALDEASVASSLAFSEKLKTVEEDRQYKARLKEQFVKSTLSLVTLQNEINDLSRRKMLADKALDEKSTQEKSMIYNAEDTLSKQDAAIHRLEDKISDRDATIGRLLFANSTLKLDASSGTIGNRLPDFSNEEAMENLGRKNR